MRFTAYTALVASASAAIHDGCSMTWDTASDPQCSGTGEACFDWQKADGSKSVGLMCGLKADCGNQFNWTNPTGGAVETYLAYCKGLSMADCGANKDQCDDKANFMCADWTDTAGNTKQLCALNGTECGHKIADHDVACWGFDGETCKGGDYCDAAAGLKCAMEFNNKTLKYTADTNKCTSKDNCGKAKDNETVWVCYGEGYTACNASTSCATPDGDNGVATCGYFKVGEKNMTGMCIDDGYCNKDNATAGKNTTYYGVDAFLLCGSVKTGLALGAAVVSAYLAM